MLVSHPNVTYVGRFRHQLWKVSAPAGEANVQGPQPKTASQVTSAQKQKEQPHTAHLRFWLDASASFPRALLSSPSFLPKSLHWHQTPDPTAKPLLASGPILTLDLQVSESQSNKEAERRSRTKRHLSLSPQQAAAAHWEAKEIWCREEPGSSSPTWEL